MAIGDDFEIQTDGDIRHVSGTDTYTVLELHRWLQNLADDATSSGNDNMDITDDKPSERATDRIITLTNGYNIDDTAAQYLYGGSIYQLDGTSMYSGLKVLGSVNSGTTELEIIQNNIKLTNYWGTGINDSEDGVLLRMLVKTRASNAEIDGSRVRVQAREWGDTFDFFNVALGEGEGVAAIATIADLQNDTDSTTVATHNVTNTEGYQLIDIGWGSSDPYYSQWTYNSEPDELKALWEWGKYVTRRDTAETIHGINGELFLGITHSYLYDTETGTAFVEDDVITWGTGATAGSGLLLALDTTGKEAHIQLLTGIAPTDGLTVTNEATTGTHDLNGAPTPRTVTKVFLGSYTGTLIGAYGIGVEGTDLGANDSVQDLDEDVNSPPVSVDFVLSGLQYDSEVRLYRVSDSSLIDGTESSYEDYTYNYQYTSDIDITVVVFNIYYQPIRLPATLGNADQTIPIQQVIDRVYEE